MATQLNKIESAILKKVSQAPYLKNSGQAIHLMFMRWIEGGLVSGTGRFSVHEISNLKFTCKDYDHAAFSCDVLAGTPPHYTNNERARYTWKLTGQHYSGRCYTI